MSTVTPIRGKELIPVLEDWLKRARAGEITALAFAAVMRDASIQEGWAGELDECAVVLYGAINILRDGYFHSRIEHYADAQCST